jgi:hypothetical protein
LDLRHYCRFKKDCSPEGVTCFQTAIDKVRIASTPFSRPWTAPKCGPDPDGIPSIGTVRCRTEVRSVRHRTLFSRNDFFISNFSISAGFEVKANYFFHPLLREKEISEFSVTLDAQRSLEYPLLLGLASQQPEDISPLIRAFTNLTSSSHNY